MKEKMIEIIQDELNELSPGIIVGMEDKLDELGFNSISFVKIIVKIEEEFDIEINDIDLDISKFIVIGDLYKYISKIN